MKVKQIQLDREWMNNPEKTVLNMELGMADRLISMATAHEYVPSDKPLIIENAFEGEDQKVKSKDDNPLPKGLVKPPKDKMIKKPRRFK